MSLHDRAVSFGPKTPSLPPYFDALTPVLISEVQRRTVLESAGDYSHLVAFLTPLCCVLVVRIAPLFDDCMDGKRVKNNRSHLKDEQVMLIQSIWAYRVVIEKVEMVYVFDFGLSLGWRWLIQVPIMTTVSRLR